MTEATAAKAPDAKLLCLGRVGPWLCRAWVLPWDISGAFQCRFGFGRSYFEEALSQGVQPWSCKSYSSSLDLCQNALLGGLLARFWGGGFQGVRDSAVRASSQLRRWLGRGP